MKRFLPLIPVLGWICSGLPLQAQLPDSGTSWVDVEPPPGALAIRVADARRPVSDSGVGTSLDMLQVTAVAQIELPAGLVPRFEAGWHEPELASGASNGGLVWGVGLSFRPTRFPLRTDPESGPRDWLAMVVDLSYRAGEAGGGDAGDLTWSCVEGVIGLEWHQIRLGSRPGPMRSGAMTVGAGVVFNAIQAEQGTFDGSEDQSVGVRFNATYHFLRNEFVQIEADWFGSSDRVLALAAGMRF